MCTHETSLSLGNPTLPCPWMAVIKDTRSCSKNSACKRTLLLQAVLAVWVGSPVRGVQEAVRNNDIVRLQETQRLYNSSAETFSMLFPEATKT